MKKSVLFTLLGLSFLIACTTTQTFPSGSDKTEGPPLPDAIQSQRAAWIKSLNEEGIDGLKKYYWDAAGMLWGRNYFQDAEPVATQWANWKPGLGPLLEQRTRAVVRHDDDHYFEMGYYKFSDKDPTIYAYATAWKAVDGEWLRELEVVQPLFEQQEVQTRDIDRARQLWVERSNAHDHEALVSQLYASDGFYVNQGKYYKGTEAISEKYSYMSRPDWEIELIPKSILKVQSDLAYELGQYKSSGTGHYLIVWEKQGERWKVLLDFNF